MERNCFLHLDDHTATDFPARISGRLRREIVSSAVYNNGTAKGLLDAEPICHHSKKRSSVAAQQRWQVSVMVRMGQHHGVIVAACICKSRTGAATALMNVKAVKSVLRWQTGKIRNHQDTTRLLIKPNASP